MKIYWIVSNYPHLHNVQAGIFYKDFAEALVKKGIDLTVIAPTPFAGSLLAAFSSKWKIYHDAPFYEEQNGVKIYRPRYFTHPGEVHRGIPHYFMLRAIRKLKLPAPDVIHGFGGYPAAFAAKKFAGNKIPFVSTFIGSDAHDYPNVNSKSLSRFTYLVQQSQKVVAVSKDLAARIFNLTTVKADVIRMPFNAAHLSSLTKPEARKKLDLSQDAFILLYAGYLYETKGINELCDALEKMKDQKDIHALFCGGTSPLLKRIEDLPNSTYLGQLPLPEVMEYMKAADVLVLPSYMEGFPGVIKEAGMTGLPVIVTNVGGIPELLNNENSFLINPKSSDEIYGAVLKVKNNYAEALAKASKLHETMFENFGIEKIVEQQMNLYSEVINAGNK